MIIAKPGTVLFLAVFFLSVTGCRDEALTLDEAVSQKEVVVETGKNVSLLYSEFGQHKVEVIAPTMKRYLTKEPYVEFPDGLRLYFYNPDGEIDSRLSANYGIGYEKEDDSCFYRNQGFHNQSNFVAINHLSLKVNPSEALI